MLKGVVNGRRSSGERERERKRDIYMCVCNLREKSTESSPLTIQRLHVLYVFPFPFHSVSLLSSTSRLETWSPTSCLALPMELQDRVVKKFFGVVKVFEEKREKT